MVFIWFLTVCSGFYIVSYGFYWFLVCFVWFLTVFVVFNGVQCVQHEITFKTRVINVFHDINVI